MPMHTCMHTILFVEYDIKAHTMLAKLIMKAVQLHYPKL